MANSAHLDKIIIKHQLHHQEVFGHVEISDRLWRNRVVEAVEIALAQAGRSWRDSVIMQFKITKLVVERPSSPKTPEVEEVVYGSPRRQTQS